MIELLFPTPIIMEKLEKPFTMEELIQIEKEFTSCSKSKENIVSINGYVLDNPIFKNLKEILTNHINEYIKTVYKPLHPVKAYITQSWLNYGTENNYHSIHNHPNSFISGVMYIEADRNTDSILFINSAYKQINLEPTSYDNLNANTWKVPVNTGDIIIFPSNLAHGVDTVDSKRHRVSIAFNSFIKGKLGSINESTELILE